MGLATFKGFQRLDFVENIKKVSESRICCKEVFMGNSNQTNLTNESKL